ncbi:hypothetical protein [Anaerosacchariphilus polymeriproducens]|uniref:Uncharacterized protein n=1 Tax=Anaerosacchariphilus polymeriproducens TaxID=1812858 RepID=A0A371ARJ0_9FIRM|nr:hypothetical protein [Anaerosacchariphilus polymeriproducens]RDU22183.1 hypothetical protein DWV06_16790 [Anaerosacchariphilus polymeriproducens]
MKTLGNISLGIGATLSLSAFILILAKREATYLEVIIALTGSFIGIIGQAVETRRRIRRVKGSINHYDNRHDS